MRGRPGGLGAALPRCGRTRTRSPAESPARDFGERSGDDVYILYTGGTTGRPKGVVWRQEDIWRVLAGGLDFFTGEPILDEFQQSRTGGREPMRGCCSCRR